MTKEEIFECYLNTVFFGNNVYGIQVVAETYFGKMVAELTFIEVAFFCWARVLVVGIRFDQRV